MNSFRNANRIVTRLSIAVTCLLLQVLSSNTVLADDNGADSKLVVTLKARVRATTSVITVADVALKIDADEATAAALGQLPLFPAPKRATRYEANDIAERLALRGVDLLLCRFDGASSILIEPAETVTSAAPNQGLFTDVTSGTSTTNQRSQQTVDEAYESASERVNILVLDLLRQRVFVGGEWDIAIEFDKASAELVADPRNRIAISGIRHPWVGTHHATLRISSSSGTNTVPVVVGIVSKTLAVVAVVPIDAGDIISARHVELAPIEGRVSAEDLVYRVEDVVGQQAKRSIQIGHQVRRASIDKPIVVSRGDTVAIYADFGEVRIRRMGKALEDGRIDDVINVESLDRERRFFARVDGYQELVVIGNGGRAANRERE